MTRMDEVLSQTLRSLTLQSSLVVLLRMLYRMVLDYCVLPPFGDFEDVVVFTKDQLIALIERSDADTTLAEIPQQIAQGIFKPVLLFSPASAPDDLLPNSGFSESEELQVLVVEEEGASIVSLKEALRPRLPDFPEWWEAPIPFAMYANGKLYINQTATLMFGSDLKRLPVRELPERDEFLVRLEGRQTPCSLTFRRLEDSIFVLEDCTSDIELAADIAWWAAVGKAWTAVLDREKRGYRRCAEGEDLKDWEAENRVFPCEWEGELLGYFCVEKTEAEKAAAPQKTAAPESKKKEKSLPRKKSVSESEKKAVKRTSASRAASSAVKAANAKENDTLKALGPQAMGLLVPGNRFSAEKDDAGETGMNVGSNGEDGADSPRRDGRRPEKNARKVRKVSLND